jgi:hypothetical protein
MQVLAENKRVRVLAQYINSMTASLSHNAAPSPPPSPRIACDCDRTTSEMRGSSTRISLSNSQRNENTINTQKHTIIYIKFK